MSRELYDVVILGGGPAGYASALYCARAGLKTIVLEHLSAGGQMTLTEIIENYPGFHEGIDGFTLGDQMQQQAEKFGAESELTAVTSVELTGDIKVVHTSDAGDFETRCVVIATGANARQLGLPNEAALADRGIHYCAACDGMRFKGKTVALVGGGNTALEDALLLARLCEKVYLIHRRDQYRAEKFYADAVAEAENIEPVLCSVVEDVDVEGGFRGVTVRNVQTDETRFLEAAALFVSVGRVPNTGFLDGAVSVDGAGYIEADETTRTSVPGVFAVGDIRTKPMRQVVTAAADGAVSSMFAQQYIEELKAK
ncbi:MAG: FAD-dependent oxidoreductase [Clostridia bacterium]|nr:FAD-dependent oxidoreductase [Clostridia bacterium]